MAILAWLSNSLVQSTMTNTAIQTCFHGARLIVSLKIVANVPRQNSLFQTVEYDSHTNRYKMLMVRILSAQLI